MARADARGLADRGRADRLAVSWVRSRVPRRSHPDLLQVSPRGELRRRSRKLPADGGTLITHHVRVHLGEKRARCLQQFQCYDEAMAMVWHLSGDLFHLFDGAYHLPDHALAYRNVTARSFESNLHRVLFSESCEAGLDWYLTYIRARRTSLQLDQWATLEPASFLQLLPWKLVRPFLSVRGKLQHLAALVQDAVG